MTLIILYKFIQKEIHIRAKSVEQVFQRVVSKTFTCATIKSQLYSCTIINIINIIKYTIIFKAIFIVRVSTKGDRTEGNCRGRFLETRAWSPVFLRVSNNSLPALMDTPSDK